MPDGNRLLERIEEGIVAHGGDLGGWTRRGDGALQLFDGRVTLRAQVDDGDSSRPGNVHAHVLTTLHDYDSETLDACLIGFGDTRDKALAEVAVIWTTGVAGPIRSFLDAKPVCMTCQAGVAGGDAARGYAQGDYGLPALRAYVGPSFARGIEDGELSSALDDTKPWFRFAAESAAPRRVHLAKAVVTSNRAGGWSRALEVDGHDVSHHDPDWPAGLPAPDVGYLTRFAVFELPQTEIERRAELDRTICHFAGNFSRYESAQALMDAMASQGFDPDLAHETEAIATIAFGRTLFEQRGVPYDPTVIRARRDGRIETGVPLMSIPAYARARALAVQLRQTMTREDFQSLCLYSAESGVLVKAMTANAELDLTKVRMYPNVVPDRGANAETMDAAVAPLTERAERGRASGKRQPPKAWWKVW